MRQPLRLFVGLLACLAVASALPGLFPRKNVTTYRYYADVKAGSIEPAPFASQFVITGLMHVAPELSNPNLKNAFYILLNVTHGVRNGEIQHFEEIQGNTLPIPDAAKVLNDPFVVIFNDHGKVKGMMINEHEAGWSRNMKQSIASMLQLDLSSMHLDVPMKPHGFSTKENTIYGECGVAYDVHRTLNLEENHFTVTKIMDPMSCSMFEQHTFNSMESEKCLIENEEEMTSASRRVFQIENTGEDLLIKSLVAHGVINYFPWNAQSEAHYILANQTMEFESMLPVDGMTLPELNMNETVTLDDVTFRKSESFYAVRAGVDPTHGRHVVNLEVLTAQLKKMLEDAAEFINLNHLQKRSLDMERAQIMNRILDTMSRMDLTSLENIFNYIADTFNDGTIMNLFLSMVPYVGTDATCLLTRNIIRKRKIEDSMAIKMLTKLPYNIRVPTESLLNEMEDVMRLGGDISPDIRQAGIFSFATMIYKTYKDQSLRGTMNSELVRYVRYYFDRMISEPKFDMKMTFLHGMGNIGIGGVHKLLEPIIRGDLKVSEKPDHLRLHAMMINLGMTWDADYIHDMYWPILSNTELPLELRIVAYSILVNQPPRMDRLMNLYWFMVYEKNEHLYNYHYTTMKSLANSANPCMTPMKEMARKLLRFIRVRPVSDILTGRWTVDYQNKKFGFGDSATVMMAADERTGTPYIGVFEFKSLNRRKPVNHLTLWMRIEGVYVPRNMDWDGVLEKPDILLEQIKRVLKKASDDMPSSKPIHIEFGIMIQGRTVFARSFDNIPGVPEIMSTMIMAKRMKFHWQTITFDELYTMQVPNDLGLPTLLHNKIPLVMSIKTDSEITSLTELMFSARLKTMLMSWRHGYHSMEVYNPIIDTWHGIRRVSEYEIILPTSMSIGYNKYTKSMKLTWPRFPRTPDTISGIRSYVANYVTVMEAEDGVLERYCGTCSSAEHVTKGKEHRKDTTLMDFDSKDIGLHFSMYRYDCERRFIPPVLQNEYMNNILNHQEDKNTWDKPIIIQAVVLREQYLHNLISPELGSCGYLIRLESSFLYPTSQVDINLRMNIETPTEEVLSSLPATKINFRGTLENKAVGTNIPVQSWTVDVNINASQGFVNNQLQVQMMRRTPGQNDLKIYVNGYTTYPTTEVDPLNRTSKTKPEIVGKLTVNIEETQNEIRVHDWVSVTILMKGEMSDEQREAVEHEEAVGMCQKDVENPNYLYAESSIVPRTLACLNEAILRTSPRKYTYTVLYKNIPDDVITPSLHAISGQLRPSVFSEYARCPAHTASGVIEIFVEYPLKNGMNLTIRTPVQEERYTGLVDRYNAPESESSLINTRFSQDFIQDVGEKKLKFCSIYPEVLLNADGAVLPFTVPNEWTLLTGDHIKHIFSVFVKRFEPKKLGLLMSVRNHTIEVIPSDTVPTVTVDGNSVNYVSGVIVGEASSYALRTVWSHNRLVIRSTYTLFDVEWTERSVALAMKSPLRGKVTGLCGHLDGTHAEKLGKVYTFGN